MIVCDTDCLYEGQTVVECLHLHAALTKTLCITDGEVCHIWIIHRNQKLQAGGANVPNKI